jgi:D-lactate dehydrogenase
MGIKIIALRCAGFDRVDLEAAQECGITVARVPAYSPYAVAEHAITLMMTLNRKVAHGFHNTNDCNFSLNGLMGRDMIGRKVGVFGTGLIGSIAARILKKGFECDVVAYDAYPNPKISDPPPAGLGIPYVSKDEFFQTCEMMTMHAPLLPTTKHTINAEAVSKMNRGVLIINTSRGPLIDTSALVVGLKKGIIGGAGLDVVENEGPYFFMDFSRKVVTDPNISILLRMPNVIMTAHQAFFTQEAMKTISTTTLKNIDGVRQGTGPPKQNGTLDTVCKPPPKSAAGPPVLMQQARQSTMDTFQRQVSEGAPVFAAPELGPVVNSATDTYKVALFSNTPYDEQWFSKMNGDLKTGLTFDYHEARLEPDTVSLAAGCQVVCIFVNDDCGEKTLRALAPLGIKMVALRCAGFNNVHLETAKELGITVARVPAYSPHAVAEHAVALALSVNRRIPQAYAKTRANDFTLQGLLGNDLGNVQLGRKTVGIIGTGLIGSIAARIFKNGFDCDVIAYDKFPNNKISDAPPEGLGIQYVELDELFKRSDIISLHAPLLPATKHTVNMEAIKKMKKGVIIVNTSRGGLIDTKALIWGIREGIIAEAGLDVVEGEDPYFFKDCTGEVLQDDDIATLLSFNNVTITAHQAFFTLEAMQTISHTTIANINGVRNGTGPPKQKGKLDTLCLPP